ncbi:hypothetical protein LEP1GSC172_1063 [Leptospira noguchii]|uniref:Uncharacterized protein n=1 Tax=Leptospira noguchii TaxID=28182 RepID=M6VXV4_9LEPT|nr:hypothetical protein LEP1GSC172_1063 [Leptospira noguchii]
MFNSILLIRIFTPKKIEIITKRKTTMSFLNFKILEYTLYFP